MGNRSSKLSAKKYFFVFQSNTPGVQQNFEK